MQSPPTLPPLPPALPPDNTSSPFPWPEVNSTASFSAEAVPSWPPYLPIYVTILNVVLFFTGTLGNALVALVVALVPEMRTPMNFYLLNLSLADLLVLLVCQPAALLEFFAQDRWLLGAALCKLVPFLEHAVVHTSTLIILSISVERYYAICRPLRKLAVCHKPQPLRVLPCVWTAAILTAIPFTVMTSLHDTLFYDGTPCQVCGTSVKEKWHYVYILTISLTFFLLPLLLLLVLYFKIIQALRTSGCALRMGQVRDASVLSSHRSRKQVIKMLVGVVVLFFVSLLPVRCVILWQVFTPEVHIRSLGPEHYYNWMWVSRLLVYANSAGNPVIYSLLSSSFQQACCRLLTGRRHAPLHLTCRASQSSHRGSVSRWSVGGGQRGGVMSPTTPASSLRLLPLDSPCFIGQQGGGGGGGSRRNSAAAAAAVLRLSSLTTCASSLSPDTPPSSSSSPLVKKGVVCSVPLKDRSCTTLL